MELYQARDNFVIRNGYYSLWCNRSDGGLVPRQGVNPSLAFDPVCKGLVYGVIGKIQFFPGADWKLLVITKRTLLGLFPGNHEVYRIDRVVFLPLAPGEVPELELDLCERHKSGSRPKRQSGGGESQQKGLQQTWRSIKSAATNIKENVKITNMPKEVKDREREKLERRLLEEILKMFNESDSFFYSPTGDITNTLQRQCGEHYENTLPLWQRVDEQFFWNKHMLQDMINNEDPLSTSWIMPIIQGYCSITHCINTFEDDDMEDITDIQRGMLPPEEFVLLLISRRSIHRAGTRYKRRGVDEDGEVANYVETEQIIRTEMHSVSFVQVRGSVPVYWSQPGFKYRPPPRLDKDEMDTQTAFRSHFAHQLKQYGEVAIINLVDQTGREKIIGDVFMRHILAFNCPLLTYITFDFHEYCRGMKFENVSVLVDSIMEVIKDMRYCWTDPKGIICEQRSVFRVNCMDCLDRTNVVQAALARQVMEIQLRKLGKLLPDQTLPASIRASFQEMWANNGDAISRQYAGTAAMKGDFTRTGERRFTGLMKDGYNSANRYYLNRFKAVYRQTLIDLMLGNPPTEDLSALIAALKNGDEEEQWTMEREECVAQLVIHCQWLLLAETEECIGGWALVDPFYSPDGELTQDQDVILLLTYDAYYVASYDDDAERITQYERIELEDLDRIEMGFEPTFKSRYLFIRIHYRLQGSSGYFHTLRTIQHRTPEDARGVLLGIADAFATARDSMSLGMKITECKLDKKKSKAPPDVIQISSKSRLSGWSKPKTKVMNKHELDVYEEDSRLQSRLREKESPRTAQAFLGTCLGDMPRPYSDPCLARRDLDEDFVRGGTRPGSSSAPMSSAGSSASDDDSGETEEMFERSGEEMLEIRMHTEADGKKEEQKPLETACEAESESQEVMKVLQSYEVKDLEGNLVNIERDEGMNTIHDHIINNGIIHSEMMEDTYRETEKLRCQSNGEYKPEVDLIRSIFDEDETFEAQGKSSELNKETEVQNQELNLSYATEDQNPRLIEDIVKPTEQVSQPDVYSAVLEQEVNPTAEVTEATVAVEGQSPMVNLSLGGTGAMRVSYKSSASADDLQCPPESRESSQQSSNRFRFTGKFLGNRSPNSRSRANILASAQARGRTSLSDLRTKLSSISFAPRSRSPRLTHKHNASADLAVEQKKYRRRKCQTTIIEL